MTKKEAVEIAKTVTNGQLEEMFMNAMVDMPYWEDRSDVNKGITKGAAWNIFAKDFNPEGKHANIAKINMIREFGDFLPKEVRIEKPPKTKLKLKVIHQEPNFDNWV